MDQIGFFEGLIQDVRYGLAKFAEESRLHSRGRAHVGVGNWREYFYFHDDQCGDDDEAAYWPSGPTRPSPLDCTLEGSVRLEQFQFVRRLRHH